MIYVCHLIHNLELGWTRRCSVRTVDPSSCHFSCGRSSLMV